MVFRWSKFLCLEVPDSKTKFVILTGCLLLEMPVSMTNYFGNILVYILSYYHYNAARMTVWVDPLLLISLYRVTEPLGMMIAGQLERRTTIPKGLAIGALLTSLSISLSYFSIVEPLALTVTLGVFHGLGGGIIIALASKTAAACFPRKRSLAMGILTLGPSVFPLLHSVLAFYWINPTNKAADYEQGNIYYFTDPEIVNRIPAFFWKIGLVTVLLEIVGFVLIQCETSEKEEVEIDLHEVQEKKHSNTEVHPISTSSTQELTILMVEKENKNGHLLAGKKADYGSKIKMKNCILDTKVTSISDGITDKETFSLRTGKDARNMISSEVSDHHLLLQDQCTHHGTAEPINVYSDGETNSNSVENDLTPRQVLASLTFWKVWLTLFLVAHTNVLLVTLYKEFGLTVINNDSLMSLAAWLDTVSMIVFRLLYSFLVDKLGLKLFVVIICTLCNVFITLMPVTLYTFYPLYIAVSIIGFGAATTVAALSYQIAMDLFGSTHYATNVGMIFTASMVAWFCDSLFTSLLIRNIGWTYVFFTGTVTSTIAFFLCLTWPSSNRK